MISTDTRLENHVNSALANFFYPFEDHHALLLRTVYFQLQLHKFTPLAKLALSVWNPCLALCLEI